MSRRFFKSSINELDALVTESWSDVALLEAVASELEHRSTARARALAEDVIARLAQLGSHTATNKSGTGHSRSGEEIEALKRRITELESENILLNFRIQFGSNGSQAKVEASPLERWGLTHDCPEFIQNAAYRSWMNHLHPDRHAHASKQEKEELTRRFQDLQVDFKKPST
jgi:hypothetical protein